MNIGAKIRELRKRNDMTQERLAEHLNVSFQAVSKWERGIAAPDISLIVALAKILRVSADELLGMNESENDIRRAELDERCDNYWKYDPEESYQLAQQAVREYPGNYKYLKWLAQSEHAMAYDSKYKEDPAMPYSQEMIDRAMKRYNMVIEECSDPQIREKAIWNAMICCRGTGRQEEALKYAQMFPHEKPITRNRALDACLQGEQLIAHRQMNCEQALGDFCISLMYIYNFATKKDSHVMAALDTEEEVLNTVFPDKKFLTFHWHLYCVYERRTQLEIYVGEYDKAWEYLQIMLGHAKAYAKLQESKGENFTCAVFDRLVITSDSATSSLPVITVGKYDFNKPFIELVKQELMTDDIYAPLRLRYDFKQIIDL